MKIHTKRPLQNIHILELKQRCYKKFSKLKTLAKDVFERTPDESKYFVLNGKKIRDRGFLGGPRNLPNSVTGPNDIKGFKWGELIFSPEDEKKLQQMKGREGIEYVKKLISEGKYKFGEAK